MAIAPEVIRPRLAAVISDQLDLAEPLGTGAFAVVFRARDRFLEREVAVKVLDPDLGPSSELQETFLREARIVASIEHPHIVPLYSAESRAGILYLVMRLLPGRTLAHRIAAEGRLAPVDAARLAHEIAQALAAAHERGVVHRDIKPENVLLDRAGHAIVTDFGVARITARGDGDGPGLSPGTPGYMSPEQILGEPVDGKADVYSLGVVLFEMLTGRPPFAAPTLSGLMLKHMSESPPHLTQYQRDVPTALATITKRALAKNPEARPSAADLCGQLAAAREPEKLLSPRRAGWRRVRRRLPLIGVAVIAAVAIWGITVSAFRIADFLTSGDPPRVDALGPSIPKLLADSLRGEGLLRGNEVMLYMFAPSSAKEREMLVITDSAFIWRGRSGTRRYQRPASLTFGATKGWNTGRARGFLGVDLPTGKVDTLFTGLSGTDLTRVLSSMRSLETTAQNVRPMDSVK